MPELVITEKRPRHSVGRKHLLIGHRMTAAIGQGTGHHGEIFRRHQNRTLPKVNIEHFGDIGFHDGIIAKQISDRAIAVSSRTLGCKDTFVNAEFSSGKPAKRIANPLKGVGAINTVDQSRTGDGAGC